ncbi:Heterochromatin protein 1 [Gryllus bimaculatus]|nr:Heterochromatin protein 1 [Gryllus bimaculatus]
MRRLSSKSKKGKGANANDSGKGSILDTEAQDNENQAPSDAEESSSDKRVSLNQSKKGKRGKKIVATKPDDADIDAESWDEENVTKKNKRVRKNTAPKTEDDDETGSDDQPLNNRPKKGKRGQNNDHAKDEEVEIKEEEQYEVEKVVDCRIQSGVKQYKIRWKGFEEDQDTWETEENLSCPDSIDAFLAENPDAFKKVAKESKSKGAKKPKKEPSSPQPKKKQRVVEPVAEEGGEKVYEVEKVVEVHFKKNGEREFLIRWKGFTTEDDTWEPEANLNCPELIEKFMQKVEKAKEVTMRELRANPQVTNRFTLNTPDNGRRLSSRHTARQR